MDKRYQKFKGCYHYCTAKHAMVSGISSECYYFITLYILKFHARSLTKTDKNNLLFFSNNRQSIPGLGKVIKPTFFQNGSTQDDEFLFKDIFRYKKVENIVININIYINICISTRNQCVYVLRNKNKQKTRLFDEFSYSFNT